MIAFPSERAERREREREPLPFGSMTGQARVITRAIARAAMAPSLKDFCLVLLDHTFGNAGYERAAGDAEPGLWCDFDLASWAAELAWARQNVYRAREALVRLRVARYCPNPDPEAPGCGRLGWNIETAAWTPLQDAYRRARYTRVGAGRPKGVLSTPAAKADERNQLDSYATQEASERNQFDFSEASERNQLDSLAEIKLITPDCLEVGREAASAALKERYVKKGYEERDQGLPPLGETAPTPSAAPTVEPATVKASKKPAREAKKELTPEQVAEREYRAALLAAVEALNGGAKAGNRAAEWAAAGRFYKWPGGPAPLERVIACYEVERTRPAWDARALSLQTVATTFAAYLRSPANYAAAVARARKAANGDITREREREAQRQVARIAPLGAPVGGDRGGWSGDGDLDKQTPEERERDRKLREAFSTMKAMKPQGSQNGATRHDERATESATETAVGQPAPGSPQADPGHGGATGDAPGTRAPAGSASVAAGRSLSAQRGASQPVRDRPRDWPQDRSEPDPISTGRLRHSSADYAADMEPWRDVREQRARALAANPYAFEDPIARLGREWDERRAAKRAAANPAAPGASAPSVPIESTSARGDDDGW